MRSGRRIRDRQTAPGEVSLLEAFEVAARCAGCVVVRPANKRFSARDLEELLPGLLRQVRTGRTVRALRNGRPRARSHRARAV